MADDMKPSRPEVAGGGNGIAVAAGSLTASDQPTAEARKGEKRAQLILQLAEVARRGGVDLSATAMQNNPELRPLYTAARDCFSGRYFWHDALVAAGLNPNQITRKKLWDKDRVKEDLLARARDHKPLNCGAVKKDDYALYQAAKRHCGSYDGALIYAGLKPKKVRLHQKAPSKEAIVLKIIDLHIHKRPLDTAHMSSGRHRRCYHTAERIFAGGWREAVETAGIDYDNCRRRKDGYWSPERVVEEIKKMRQAKQPVNAGYVQSHRNDLYIKGSRLFDGGWNEALSASGLNPDEIRLRNASLSKPQLIEAIRALDRLDRDLSVSGMSASDDAHCRSIYYMAIYRFGSWSKAVIAAGLPYEQIRKKRVLTFEALAETARKLEAQGQSLKAVDIQSSDGLSWLYEAALRRFDSWREFLDRVGLDGNRYCSITDWRNGQEVLDHLRSNYDTGVVTGAARDSNLSSAARRYFGGISNAVEAAGMVYCRNGKIGPEQLADERVVGVLYRYNANFLEQLARQVFFGRKNRGLRTLSIMDLSGEAFITMLEILPEKPAQEGIREFCRRRIYRALTQTNAKMFQETTFGEEVYLDIFRIDEETFP